MHGPLVIVLFSRWLLRALRPVQDNQIAPALPAQKGYAARRRSSFPPVGCFNSHGCYTMREGDNNCLDQDHRPFQEAEA